MKKIGLGIGALLIIIIVGFFSEMSEKSNLPEDIRVHIESKADLITLAEPVPGTEVGSPLTVHGEAKGYWFFEASFPIILTDADGIIIAEGYVTAQSDWMTEDFVPFEGTLEFAPQGDRGILILKRANASGLPEHDDALEIPVTF
ncbi:Gmad2 immunoglobulin-like domain-containing protein [Candidatus Kaiserbacteria bacterium]|nr:Gmad2 immunoglobulin-like domain-containing protein [Candidatus Kaiserbacteria bacterium]